MRPYDIISKKRDGHKLSREEILAMVNGFTAGEIPDYQMAAFLMAVFIRKLDGEERADLTLGMLNSGVRMDFSDVPGYKVDKHSTGGVGDGVSLALAPLVAEAGARIPMMSGRGLGHTGGTLDKLESIAGFRVTLTREEVKQSLRETGLVIMGQTADVAPADRLMYALRDVTATVNSMDLISGSIMSKKLAEGMDGLILDVKTGQGAFMVTFDDSVALAKSMIEIGVNLGKDMRALITDMNQPLGFAVGNALEMIQAIEIVKGGGPADLVEVVLQHGSRMLVMAGLAKNIEEGRAVLVKIRASGRAVGRLCRWIELQGGDPKVVDDYRRFPQAPHVIELKSPADGYVADINALELGKISVDLGAGRITKDTKIDYAVGYVLQAKVGSKVSRGDVLMLAHVNDRAKFEKAGPGLLAAYKFSATAPKVPPLVYAEVTIDQVTRLDLPRP